MSERIRILVAEDHLVARVGVTTIVNMQPDMTVVAEAANGQQAVELYRQHARYAHAHSGWRSGGQGDS
jgi:two-component system NarL family response regulator